MLGGTRIPMTLVAIQYSRSPLNKQTFSLQYTLFPRRGPTRVHGCLPMNL